MFHLLTALLLSTSAIVDLRVTTVDEQVVEGKLSAWEDDRIELIGIEGSKLQLENNQVLKVALATENQSVRSSEDETGKLTLLDSSEIEIRGMTGTGESCDVSTIASLSSPDDSLTVPLKAIRFVQLLPLEESDAGITSQWSDIQQTEANGDLIVIRKPGTTNLNFVEGTLGDISEESVQFTLDGDTLPVGRGKVFGLVYFRSESAPAAASALITGQGFSLYAEKVSMLGDSLIVTSSLLGELKIPADSVKTVDFSIDRVRYLSDLQPLRSKWVPNEFTAPLSSLLGGISRDRGFYSSSLQLEYPAAELSAEEAGSAGLAKRVDFEKGLAIRSKSELSYRVPKGFSRFRTTAGIDPRTASTGSVRLVITGKGKTLFDQAIRGGETPVEVECNVAGFREIQFVVDYGSSGPAAAVGDNLHLGGARFTK